jgi:transcriptional regulator with XRE-family HTH domain
MIRMKLLRLAAERSQWDVATSVGISQGRYSMLERELVPPTDEERVKLAAALAVPARTLFRSVVTPTRARSAARLTQAATRAERL